MTASARIGLLTAVLFVALCAPQRAHGYALNGYRWPNGADITMHLQLTRTGLPLQDGSPSWNASFADAMSLWGPDIYAVRFLESEVPSSQEGGNGINDVFFAYTIYGDSFGSNTFAVTTYLSSAPGVFSEADVIFNSVRPWNSYRGPQQGSGANALYDLHRVALHELGHVLGVDHPDQHGQTVTAIMNSIIGDLDSLAADDHDGAGFLYGIPLTSSLYPPPVPSGNLFSYQITAGNNPTSFSAVGLPPGLTVDPATGLVSGRCPTSGTFDVAMSAVGTIGTARGRVRIVINALPLTSPPNPTPILVGDSFFYQITAGNNPTTFTAINLPAGLTLDPNTGVISGTPAAAGYYTFVVVAHGPTSEASGPIILTVQGPHITISSSPPAWELGDNVIYQITVSHPASSFSVTGLPPGFQVNASTGLISGVAANAGTFVIWIQAQTAYGIASGSVYLQIAAPRITSPVSLPLVTIGGGVSYQITASNHPTSFAASNQKKSSPARSVPLSPSPERWRIQF